MITLNDTEYLEIKDVAAILHLSERSVMRLVAENKIKAFKPSKRKTYFSEEMIKNYLEGK